MALISWQIPGHLQCLLRTQGLLRQEVRMASGFLFFRTELAYIFAFCSVDTRHLGDGGPGSADHLGKLPISSSSLCQACSLKLLQPPLQVLWFL